MKYAKYLSYILLTLMFISTSAFAQMFQHTKGIICGPTPIMMNSLDKIGETNIILLGHVDNLKGGEQVIATVHRNDDTGSFSVIETASMGFSCMVSAGKMVESKVEEPKKSPLPQLNKPEKKEVPKAVPEKDGGTKTLFRPLSEGIVIKFTISQ